MKQAADALQKFKIPHEMMVLSAHRTPNAVGLYAESASKKGIRVIIAGAGGAAHLPGMLAAHSTLPVIGVPCPVNGLQGQDALWSIVQMPKGIPVATVAIGNGWNAGVLAAQMLAISDSPEGQRISNSLLQYKTEMENAVIEMNKKITKG
jgi:5-(carboxyamino)imidazole ribonucleotide mutase